MTRSKLKTLKKAEKVIVNTVKITGSIVFLTVWSYVMYYAICELPKFIF